VSFSVNEFLDVSDNFFQVCLLYRRVRLEHRVGDQVINLGKILTNSCSMGSMVKAFVSLV
jgi:hypothetical protein